MSAPKATAYDIIGHLCAFIRDDVGDRDQWRTLPVLARTCKAFFEPAVAAIWRDVPYLMVLAHICPPDAWRISRKQREQGRMDHKAVHLRRALVPSDLARLLVYAPHVKTLGHPRVCTVAYKTAQSAIESLYGLLSAATEVLFPNLLRMLVMNTAITHLSMLLGPRVEEMVVRPEKDQLVEDPRTLRALRSIPHRCPRLRFLDMGNSPTATECSRAIAEMLPALEAMTHFAMPSAPVSPAALKALASLRALQFLQIVLPEVDDFTAALTTRSDTHPSFDRLLFLIIDAASPEHTLRFLAHVSSRSLALLTIRYASVPDAQHLEALFTVLASHPCRGKLQGLSLSAPYNPLLAWPRRLTNDTFTPLLELHRMKVLTLDSIAVDVNDQGLLAMAKAWPQLNTLSLGVQRWGDDHPPCATILGLLPLIEACPELDRIGYRMRTDVLHSYYAVQLHGRPGNGITTDLDVELEVGDSRIHDSIEVATFLSDICPKLWFISNSWRSADDNNGEPEAANLRDEEDMHEKWNEVVEYIPHFALVRKQERNDLRP